MISNPTQTPISDPRVIISLICHIGVGRDGFQGPGVRIHDDYSKGMGGDPGHVEEPFTA